MNWQVLKLSKILTQHVSKIYPKHLIFSSNLNSLVTPVPLPLWIGSGGAKRVKCLKIFDNETLLFKILENLFQA